MAAAAAALPPVSARSSRLSEVSDLPKCRLGPRVLLGSFRARFRVNSWLEVLGDACWLNLGLVAAASLVFAIFTVIFVARI